MKLFFWWIERCGEAHQLKIKWSLQHLSKLAASWETLEIFWRATVAVSSHGKYFSHSDVDPRYINPLLNPINVSAYSLWTCLQSDDALIAEACQQLYSKYRPEEEASIFQNTFQSSISCHAIKKKCNCIHLPATI